MFNVQLGSGVKRLWNIISLVIVIIMPTQMIWPAFAEAWSVSQGGVQVVRSQETSQPTEVIDTEIQAPEPTPVPLTRQAEASNSLFLPLVMNNFSPPKMTPIEGENGGDFTLADDVALSVAPNAVTQTATLEFQGDIPITRPPLNQTPVNDGFDIQLRTAEGQLLTRFEPEVNPREVTGVEGSVQTQYVVTNTAIITLSYTEAQVQGLDESKLLLYRQNEAGKWISQLSLVDTDKNIVYGPLNFTGRYALFAPSQIQPLQASRPPTQTITTTLIFDPDHGGSDPGGQVTSPAAYAIEEKMLNLDVALTMKDWFETCGVEVLLTRSDDASLSSQWRADFINANAPDAAVTVAFNVWQSQMSYFVGGPMGLADFAKPDDVTLAETLVYSIGETTDLPTNRGVKDASAWMGGLYLPTNVPSVRYAQIESAFIDSYNDRDRVIDPKLDHVAGGIYNGLITELGLSNCQLFDEQVTDDRQRRTLGLNNWATFTAQGVNPVTGNQFQWARDLFVPGIGLNVDFVRYYNSQSTEVGLFGLGWSSIFDMVLTFLDGGVIQARYNDGQLVHFTPDGSGYQADPGIYDTLTFNGGEYSLTTPEQISFVFDAAGVLQRITDATGNAITLNYNGGILDSVVDDAGRVFDITTNAAGLITKITDPAGREVEYGYGTVNRERTEYLRSLRGAEAMQNSNQLLSMTDARDGTTNYGYDPAGGYLNSISDPEGIGYLENSYTPDGRVSGQTNGNGEQGTWDYDLANMRAVFTDFEGNTTTYIFDSKYRVVEEIDALNQSVTYEYDDADNITAMTDKRGNTWRYEYDERGNKTRQIDPTDEWSLYKEDITTWTYDERNNMLSMTDALNNTWNYEYDDSDNLIKVIEPNQAETVAEYDDKGQIIYLKDAEGRESRFEYDDKGNQTKINKADDGWVEKTFDDAGRELTITECIDPPACSETRTTTNEYDGNGNLTKTIDPEGEETLFEYDGNNMLIEKTDRRDGVWFFEYDDNLNPILERDAEGRETIHTYNKMNKRLSTTDAEDRVTRFEYDPLYRTVVVTNAKGDLYNYEYDPNGNLILFTDPAKNQTRMVYDVTNRRKFVYDAIGGQTEYCYDALDRIIWQFDPRRAKTEYVYDSVGNMVEVIDPLGNRVQMEFDRVHNRTALIEGIPSDGLTVDGNRTSFTYDVLNREIARTDPLQRVTRTEYDGVGNVIAVTDPMSNTYRYTYNLNDWVLQEENPLGDLTRYTYDAEGNAISITDANDNTSFYEYDLVGQTKVITDPLSQVTRFEYDKVGNQVKVINAMNQTMVYTYDELNLTIAERDNMGHVTRYTYDELRRMIAKTDANELTIEYDYNPMGWLTSVTDPLSGTTRYIYDSVGNRTEIVDANGITTTFEFNFLNQLEQEINPLGDRWNYNYDPSGNMVRRVDAKQQATLYNYDAANQLIATIYGSTGLSVTFAYDANGNESEMRDWNGVFTYTYDVLNRRISATDYRGRTLGWSYDAVGNQVTMTYPDGRVISKSYDAADQLATLTDFQNRQTEWQYNPLGYITEQANPNATRLSYQYDAANRLTDLSNIGPGNSTIASYAYSVDAVGNRTQTVEQRGGQSVVRNYEYDDLYRLTNARTNTGQNMDYAYDPVGNRLEKTGQPEPNSNGNTPDPEDLTYSYNALNSMLTAGETAFDFDANGNRIRKTEALSQSKYAATALNAPWGLTATVVTDYGYDYENRLVSVTTIISADGLSYPAMEAEYVYDGYGRRVEKYVTEYLTQTGTLALPDSFLRHYVFDGLEPVAEYDYEAIPQNPDVTRFYVYGNGKMVQQMRLDASGEQTLWYHYDGLGSVVALTDEAGNDVCQTRYDEYGNPLQDCLDLNHYTYTGEEYDAETGLYHFFARYYDAEAGVWITLDKYRGEIGDPITLHRTQYVGNNSINQIDYYGFYWETAWDIASIGLGLVSLKENVSEGNWGWATVDVIGLVVDVAALVAPVPGGASVGIKALRAGDKAADGAKAAKNAKNAQNSVESANDLKNTQNSVEGASDVKNTYDTRLPKSDGSWDGTPGNSKWYSDKPEVTDITKGEPIPFKDGYPDFSKWSEAEVSLPEIKGTSTDFYRADKEFAIQKGWYNEHGNPNVDRAKLYRQENNLSWHHVQNSNNLQLVPTELNQKIPHSGSASQARNDDL